MCSLTQETDILPLASALPGAAQAAPIESFEAGELEAALLVIRAAQAALSAVVVRIGRRADRLAETGQAAPAAELLLGRGRVRGRTARAEAKRVRLVDRLPSLSPLVVAGVFGPEQLDSLARVTDGLSDDELSLLDVDAVVADAARLPADTFDAAVKRAIVNLKRKHRPLTTDDKRTASEVRHWFDDNTGMGHLHAVLDPERYEAVATAVDQHTSALAASDRGTTISKNANLAAAALVDLVTDSGARHHRHPHLTVVVDHHSGEAETGDGRPISPDAAARLSCDAIIQLVNLGRNGLPTNVGRKYRTATDAQWTAIRAFYSSCGWAGCSRALSHCQLHHIRPWQEGGATDLDNLIPLCSEHHHRVHEGRWTIRLLADRSLEIVRPDGVPHLTTPPPRRSWPPPGRADSTAP